MNKHLIIPVSILMVLLVLTGAVIFLRNNMAVRSFRLEDERSKISIRYPVTGCLKADVDIKSFIDRNLNDFLGTLGEPLPPGAPKWQYVFMADHKVYSSNLNKDIISVRADIYIFTGGAHGITSVFTGVYDKRRNERLALDKLFKPSVNWVRTLSDKAAPLLTDKLGQYADQKWILEGSGPKADNFEDFVISGDDLVLIFPQYQVAPGAAGIQEINIPLKDLNEMLSPRIRSI